MSQSAQKTAQQERSSMRDSGTQSTVQHRSPALSASQQGTPKQREITLEDITQMEEDAVVEIEPKELTLQRAKVLVAFLRNQQALKKLLRTEKRFDYILENFRLQKQLWRYLLNAFDRRCEICGLDQRELAWLVKYNAVVDAFGAVQI